MSIRNFVYLDNEKLRSVSSQLFEGVTDYVLASKSEFSEERNHQEGPKNSGQVLADIFRKQSSSDEFKFLADHAFHILEERLEKDKLLVDLERVHAGNLSNCFVKVRGGIFLNDMAKSTELLKNFNSLGLAMWRVQNDEMQVGGAVASDKDAKKGAQESALQLNEKVAAAAADIIEFGFGDLLEVYMRVGDLELSAPIRRDFLREDDHLFIQKYSRRPAFPFTILGIVSHNPSREHSVEIPNVIDAADPKAAMRYLAMHMAAIEQEYGSKGHAEYVIDPIAIYSEVAEI